MSNKNEENILYGGPDPPLIDDESQSLGDVLLKKLTINPNDVMFVSITFVIFFMCIEKIKKEKL